MSTYTKTKLVIFQAVWLMLYVVPATGMNTDDAPESVTLDYLQELYEEVTFDHQMHSEMYDCSACHHHTTGTGAQSENCKRCHASSAPSQDVSCSGCHEEKKNLPVATGKKTTDSSIYHIDKPGLKGALHLQCLGCHRSENGPTHCQECHKLTPAGRTRFAIRK